MNTKKCICVLLLFVLTATTTVLTAQQLFLETGKTNSSFNYKDSQGVRLDNLESTTHSFMSIGYRSNFLTKKLNATLGLSYSGYGAIGSDALLEGILEWEANYLELNLGLDYSLFNIQNATFYIKGATSTGFLIQGTQILNNKIIDLKEVDDFNSALINFKTGAGFIYPVSSNWSFYVQYLFGSSLNLSGNGGDESLKIKSRNLSFGVLIKPSK